MLTFATTSNQSTSTGRAHGRHLIRHPFARRSVRREINSGLGAGRTALKLGYEGDKRCGERERESEIERESVRARDRGKDKEGGRRVTIEEGRDFIGTFH